MAVACFRRSFGAPKPDARQPNPRCQCQHALMYLGRVLRVSVGASPSSQLQLRASASSLEILWSLFALPWMHHWLCRLVSQQSQALRGICLLDCWPEHIRTEPTIRFDLMVAARSPDVPFTGPGRLSRCEGCRFALRAPDCSQHESMPSTASSIPAYPSTLSPERQIPYLTLLNPEPYMILKRPEALEAHDPALFIGPSSMSVPPCRRAQRCSGGPW